MALSKQSILSHTGSFKTEEVHVPAWADETGDDVVLVRGMTLREFELNQSSADDGKTTARVLSRCVIDETGGRVFSDADIPALAELPMTQVAPLSQAIARLSGIVQDVDAGDQVDAAVDEAGKGSGLTTGSEPSSD